MRRADNTDRHQSFKRELDAHTLNERWSIFVQVPLANHQLLLARCHENLDLSEESRERK